MTDDAAEHEASIRREYVTNGGAAAGEIETDRVTAGAHE
jgi:hypothetical protein